MNAKAVVTYQHYSPKLASYLMSLGSRGGDDDDGGDEEVVLEVEAGDR